MPDTQTESEQAVGFLLVLQVQHDTDQRSLHRRRFEFDHSKYSTQVIQGLDFRMKVM